ncbi:hypothetical protein ACLB2K_062731 [Fragaria x ananassa]
MNNNDEAAPNDIKNASIPLESRIKEKLQKLPPLSSSCFIYRVLERLRSLNPNVYTPKVVSIVPLHHGKDTLQDMEENKYRCSLVQVQIIFITVVHHTIVQLTVRRLKIKKGF